MALQWKDISYHSPMIQASNYRPSEWTSTRQERIARANQDAFLSEFQAIMDKNQKARNELESSILSQFRQQPINWQQIQNQQSNLPVQTDPIDFNAQNTTQYIEPNISKPTTVPLAMNQLQEYSKANEDIKDKHWDSAYNFGIEGFGSFLPANQKWRITSGFGERNIAVGSRYHRGYDIATPKGTPINSPFENAVIKNIYTDSKGGGNTIELYDPVTHNTVQFLHLDKFGSFKKGDKITSKDIIGYTGNTSGNPLKSYGYHLDIRVYDKWGRYLTHNGKTINSRHYRR